jgi:NADPH:quinone reductase-like Zn-dependent oxidoreductase
MGGRSPAGGALVRAVGRDVETGEEVFALTPSDRDGVAADYASVLSAVLAPKPASLTHVEAAALPVGGLSAWQGLFVHGHLQPGDRVLVTGSSGGVGHLPVQLARHAGAKVVDDAPAELVFDTVGRELPPWRGVSSRSRRRCRARPTSS